MTTKWKIISGFVVMLLILGSVAAIGYSSLTGATSAFTEYQRVSRANVLTSDLLAGQNASTALTRQFLISTDPRLIESARDEIKNNQALIVECKSLLRLKESLDALDTMDKVAVDQLRVSLALEKAVATTVDTYEQKMRPAGQAFTRDLVAMARRAGETGARDAAQAILPMLDSMASVRAAFGRFAYSRTQANADMATEVLAGVGKDMNALKTILATDEGRAMLAELQRPYGDMANAAAAMHAAALEALTLTGRLAEMNANVRTLITRISGDINTIMQNQGTRTVRVNETAQKTVLAGAGIGVLCSILLAGFTIFGLVRTLRGMRGFAQAIAEGDFEARIASREKGEVGETLASMRQIPVVLSSILADFQKLGQHIEAGELSAKGEANAYKGGFSTLVTGTNEILDRFLLLLENIPSPVIVLNKDLRITFVNAAGRAVAGEDYKGRTCRQVMAREDADTPADALRKAADYLRPATAETVAHPRGKSMDVSYTAIPMVNHEGKLTSVLQLITDLTAVKETARTIRKVADQAASISNRVAAASEELSAQVEQVSRGAETERARVESTASAMTEMNSTVMEVAKNAGQASEQSETTRNKAGDGAALVDKVVQSINQVNRVATTLQTSMHERGEQAQNIGGVMSVISDIADQTNLLALNAAIEAARAGEAGRGFAVVADEVRKLAEKTMSATHEVGANITAIQQSAHTNIEEVNTAAEAITEATDLANTSGRALTEIVSLASANSSVVASIATAAEQQSATSEEINHSIEEISRIVAETADGMTQAACAVQELSHMAQELNRVMGDLRH
jgi:methyl-accepting chemotaxis protein